MNKLKYTLENQKIRQKLTYIAIIHRTVSFFNNSFDHNLLKAGTLASLLSNYA